MSSKNEFYSSLSDKRISDKEYQHFPKFCNKTEIKTIKDYHILYLRCDVLLLADVLEHFRNRSQENYGLCPSRYLSGPTSSWDVLGCMTKFELDLI